MPDKKGARVASKAQLAAAATRCLSTKSALYGPSPQGRRLTALDRKLPAHGVSQCDAQMYALSM
jgi:hypothetical protein